MRSTEADHLFLIITSPTMIESKIINVSVNCASVSIFFYTLPSEDLYLKKFIVCMNNLAHILNYRNIKRYIFH